MDSDSPLSEIDPHEVIADSEDEGKATSSGKSQDDHTLSRSPGQELTTSHDAPVDHINYFAGFQEPLLPVPSIADRAKTRKRKSKTQRMVDILELTDEDELALKPAERKRKKTTKPKETSKDISALVPAQRSQGVDGGTGATFQIAPLVDFRMINSKPKVAPRPIKKKLVQPDPSFHRIPQPSIPVPISPFPPQYYPPDTSPDHDLPPSDPPLTSSMRLDEPPQLPPIEFLPPEPIDSDVLLSSSHPGENIDELQESLTNGRVNRNSELTVLQPPPPPTFFAGSSSPAGVGVPAPAVPSPRRVFALSSLIDLTDIPSTLTEPAALDVNAAGLTKATKARKPRKPRKKADAGEDGSRPAETPQPTKKNKGKGKAPQVFVEIPLPPPAFDRAHGSSNMQKRKRGNVLPPNGLLLHVNSDSAGANTVAGPSSPLIGQDKQDGLSGTADVRPPEMESMPYKGRRKIAEELPEPDGLSHVLPSTNKKSKAADSLDDLEAVEKSLPTTLKPSKKRKKGEGDKTSEDNASKSPQIVRVTKGKRRIVIASDDEDVQLNREDPPLPLEERGVKEAESEATGGNASHSDLTNQASSQNDRDPPKDVQSVERDSKEDDSSCKKAMVLPPSTPSVNKYPSLSSRYSVAPQSQTSGMLELLRRVNSHPNSPFAAGKGSPIPGSAYSPYLKSSRRTLSRIAPLHPNRKPPPPPLPPPPPRKKSKKELDLEEKWEEEIIDDIGGITEWLALSESEKRDLKRAKRDREMGYCED